MIFLKRDEDGEFPVLPQPTNPRLMHQHPGVVLGKTKFGVVIFVITSPKTSDQQSLAVKIGDARGVIVPIPIFCTSSLKGMAQVDLKDDVLEARLRSMALGAKEAIVFDRHRMLAAGFQNPLYVH